MEFRLPELGEGVTEGELVKWLVKPGDQVKDDQPLCEIMTDKATIEIPSPFTGSIKELHAKEGEVVKVHQMMFSGEAVGAAGKAASSTSPSANAPQTKSPAQPTHTQPTDVPEKSVAAAVSSSAKSSVASTTAAPAANASANAAGDASTQDVLASPSTRRFARESGVALGNVEASGPHGRVLQGV